MGGFGEQVFFFLGVAGWLQEKRMKLEEKDSSDRRELKLKSRDF